MNQIEVMRPSRTYKDGIGKPVVKKLWDEVINSHRWMVVFPPRNNFGCWVIEPESIACAKAENWCATMNHRQRMPSPGANHE